MPIYPTHLTTHDLPPCPPTRGARHRKHGPLTHGPDWSAADAALLSALGRLDIPADFAYRVFCMRAEHPRTAIAVGARALKSDDARVRRFGSRMIYWAQRGHARAARREERRRDAEACFAAQGALPSSPETECGDDEVRTIALGALNPRELDTIDLRLDGMTLGDIGERYRISAERVRQILTRALVRVRLAAAPEDE